MSITDAVRRRSSDQVLVRTDQRHLLQVFARTWQVRAAGWVDDETSALQREDAAQLGALVEVVAGRHTDRTEVGVEDGERVTGREAIGLERDTEMELSVRPDHPVGRDDVHRVEDRVRVAALFEPVDHVEAVRRGHVDHRLAGRSVRGFGLGAMPVAEPVGVAALWA